MRPTQEQIYGLERFEQLEDLSCETWIHDTLTAEQRQAVHDTKMEGVIYSLHKFINLAIMANPNILDVLFCRDEEVLHASSVGTKLRQHRDLFVSAKAKHTFSGYAFAQLKRIKHHRAWLLNPPTRKPTRADFELPNAPTIPRDQLGIVSAAIKKQLDTWKIHDSEAEPAIMIPLMERVERFLTEVKASQDLVVEAGRAANIPDNLVKVYQQERAYENAKQHYEQYENWKQSRNRDRAELEKRYGYDTKHAAHLVRLLRMGKEVLLTGNVNVWREDREELLAIRNGKLSYDDLIAMTETMNHELETIYENEQYVVPHTPNHEKIQKLTIELTKESLE